jgi:hypothetical protein
MLVVTSETMAMACWVSRDVQGRFTGDAGLVNLAGVWVYRHKTPCGLKLDKECDASIDEVQESSVDFVHNVPVSVSRKLWQNALVHPYVPE